MNSRLFDADSGIKQRSRIVFSQNNYRNSANNVIQHYLGRKEGDRTFTCKCSAEVEVLEQPTNGTKVKSKGEGGNSGYGGVSEDLYVLSIFGDWNLKRLQCTPRATNPPGRCAEPHAVADALLKLPNYKDTGIISKITVGQAIDKRGYIKPRCLTCKKWINRKNNVFRCYLKRFI